MHKLKMKFILYNKKAKTGFQSTHDLCWIFIDLHQPGKITPHFMEENIKIALFVNANRL